MSAFGGVLGRYIVPITVFLLLDCISINMDSNMLGIKIDKSGLCLYLYVFYVHCHPPPPPLESVVSVLV